MAEIAFESPQEIAEKLSRYEDLFKYRYTEKEDGYRKATQRSSRCVCVCVCITVCAFE